MSIALSSLDINRVICLNEFFISIKKPTIFLQLFIIQIIINPLLNILIIIISSNLQTSNLSYGDGTNEWKFGLSILYLLLILDLIIYCLHKQNEAFKL